MVVTTKVVEKLAEDEHLMKNLEILIAHHLSGEISEFSKQFLVWLFRQTKKLTQGFGVQLSPFSPSAQEQIESDLGHKSLKKLKETLTSLLPEFSFVVKRATWGLVIKQGTYERIDKREVCGPLEILVILKSGQGLPLIHFKENDITSIRLPKTKTYTNPDKRGGYYWVNESDDETAKVP